VYFADVALKVKKHDEFLSYHVFLLLPKNLNWIVKHTLGCFL